MPFSKYKLFISLNPVYKATQNRMLHITLKITCDNFAFFIKQLISEAIAFNKPTKIKIPGCSNRNNTPSCIPPHTINNMTIATHIKPSNEKKIITLLPRSQQFLYNYIYSQVLLKNRHFAQEIFLGFYVLSAQFLYLQQ